MGKKRRRGGRGRKVGVTATDGPAPEQLTAAPNPQLSNEEGTAESLDRVQKSETCKESCVNDQNGTLEKASSKHGENGTLPEISASKPLVFAWRPSGDDVLVEMFQLAGGRCLKCYEKVESHEMVLCSGHFICQNCFLTCSCAEQDENSQNPQEKEPASGKLPRAADYKCRDVSTSNDLSLDEQQFQLECLLYHPQQAS